MGCVARRENFMIVAENYDVIIKDVAVKKSSKSNCLETCKGHDTIVSLSAGDDTRPAEA